MPAGVSIEHQLACVARELALRESAYPKWVASGRMKKEVAERELARMRAVMETLKAVQAGPSSAAGQVGQYRAALVQCVSVAKAWHGEEAFDIYFNHSPEMKLIRELLGPMPEPS